MSQNNQTLINGGEELDVLLLDGNAEKVKVKLLKISQFEEYLRVVDKEAQAAELLCDKPEGWGETLAPASLMDVVERGHDINFTSVYRWANRRATMNETMLPLAQKGQALASHLQSSAQT